MSAHASQATAHGHQGEHAGHGHVIVPMFTLRSILLALMFFTLLTVGLSKGEQWMADTFHFIIPGWVNVAVALSIAAVKTALVVLFFMQLKYDSPVNGMIFIFTLITVTFFLGFTMIDLGKRGTLDRFKGHYIVPGGTGLGSEGPKVRYARERAALEGTSHADPHAHSAIDEHETAATPERGLFTNAGYRAAVPELGSSSNVARPVSGLTLPGFAPKHTGHDETHDAAEMNEAETEALEPAPAKGEAPAPPSGH